MAFGTELTLQGFFRSRGPSSNILQLHWKHCRRFFVRTHYGIHLPTEDEQLDPSRFSQFGFRFGRLSEFRRRIWISLQGFNFPSPVCHFLYHSITSFTIDFAIENPTRICASMVIVADINFVEELCVDYISRTLEFIQPRQVVAAAYMGETSMARTSRESRNGAEVDSNETFTLGISAEVRGGAAVDSNAEREMIRRRRGERVVEGGEEADCSICLQGLSGEEVMRTECGHIYHEECIFKWLKQNQTCPLCRRPI